MTIDLSKLKTLAEAAKRAPYDHLAANDYGMSMPPATALELIAEIERHRLVEAEGCKPDLINSPFFYALAGPDGKPHYDDFCVANNPADLKRHEKGITIVPLYRHPAPTVQQGVPIGYMNQASIDAVQHDGQALIMVGVNGFPPGDQAIPVYTHADPGEVERLRKELEIALSDIKVEQRVSRNLRQHKTDYMEAAEESRKALLAKLAEQESLLRDCFKSMLKGGYAKPLRERIKVALAATAELGGQP